MEAGLPIPAYGQLLKLSHAFNILDARGAVGVTERATCFAAMRSLARQIAGELAPVLCVAGQVLMAGGRGVHRQSAGENVSEDLRPMMSVVCTLLAQIFLAEVFLPPCREVPDGMYCDVAGICCSMTPGI